MTEKQYVSLLIIVSLVMLVLLCVIIIGGFIQQSRYHGNTPGYRPQWDGSKWVREPGVFVCSDFTDEMRGWLGCVGIETVEVNGVLKDGGGIHAWVGINVFGSVWNFEPQTLMFFNPGDDFSSWKVVTD